MTKSFKTSKTASTELETTSYREELNMKCPYCGSDDTYFRQFQPEGEEYKCRGCEAVFVKSKRP
jgi:transposase-like protein